MNSSLPPNFGLLCFVLVIAGMALAWVLGIAFGGFKVGKLAFRLEIPIPREQFANFQQRLLIRLGELGFENSTQPGQFVQRGAEFANPVSFTHAKTPKLFEWSVDDSNPAMLKAILSLRYLVTILGDTGESAYADAVLKYVSNENDAMRIVANRSSFAFNSIVLGLWTWLAIFGLRMIGVEPVLPVILVLGATAFSIGVIAIVVIAIKPGELSGIPHAVIGMVAAVSAVAYAATSSLL